MMPPVSVCHQLSWNGRPKASWPQTTASGFSGSPTLARKRRAGERRRRARAAPAFISIREPGGGGGHGGGIVDGTGDGGRAVVVADEDDVLQLWQALAQGSDLAGVERLRRQQGLRAADGQARVDRLRPEGGE